jgi:hypothetical protein
MPFACRQMEPMWGRVIHKANLRSSAHRPPSPPLLHHELFSRACDGAGRPTRASQEVDDPVSGKLITTRCLVRRGVRAWIGDRILPHRNLRHNRSFLSVFSATSDSRSRNPRANRDTFRLHACLHTGHPSSATPMRSPIAMQRNGEVVVEELENGFYAKHTDTSTWYPAFVFQALWLAGSRGLLLIK